MHCTNSGPTPFDSFFASIPQLAAGFETKCGLLYVRPGQIREVLEQTANCYLAFHALGLKSSPSIAKLLNNQDAFQRILMPILSLYYLCHKYTPLYSLNELARLTDLFVTHTFLNQQNLVATGLAGQRFEISPWLDRVLGRLYHFRPELIELYTRCFNVNPTSGYQESLDQIVRSLMIVRDHFLRIKLAILNRLRKVLSSHSTEGMWNDCMEIIAVGLSASQVNLLLQLDNGYASFDRGRAASQSVKEDQLGGGLVEMLGMIYHVEKEIKIGTFAKTRRALSKVLGTTAGPGAIIETSQVIKVFLSTRSRHLDDALSIYDTLFKAQGDFWDEFAQRLDTSFRNDIQVELLPGFLVPGKHTELYKEEILSFAEQFKNRFEATGLPPKLTVEATVASQARKKAVIARFPSPQGLTWNDVSVSVVSNDSIKISAKGISKRFTYVEIGCKDERKGDVQDTRWYLLREFADPHNSGEIRIHRDTQVYWIDNLRMVKAGIIDLIKRLKAVMGISDNPIKFDKRTRSYRTLFRIMDESFSSGTYREI